MTKVPASRPRKRTHLSGEQIASLQASFDNNPLPDATIRHRLAVALNITERTVQIWFQNRRAKARKMEAGPSNASTSRYQATFRTMMTPDQFEKQSSAPPPSSMTATMASQQTRASSAATRQRPRSASKPEPPKPKFLDHLMPPTRAMSEDHLLQPHDSLSLSPAEMPLVMLPAQLLRIGTWTRFASTVTDDFGLLCTCNGSGLVWQIQANGQDFRIHIPMAAIAHLSFGPLPEDPTMASLQVQLDSSCLAFSMSLHKREWVRCGDFSEDMQATRLCTHELQGSYDVLQQSLMDLMTQFPEWMPKLLFSPIELCRDMTLSPSATPEPSMMMYHQQQHHHHHPMAHAAAAPIQHHHHHVDTVVSAPNAAMVAAAPKMVDPAASLMTLQAPFYYPSVDPVYTADQVHDDAHYYQAFMLNDASINAA
ncbi:hypothetical protein BC940DRAFT_351950 [Gongronella butleri]|nr:hypothetical protein BC940DRAFT_351950 [Gongronella butleri]